MEKTLKFNSQVATNRSQSERLLALGLKKETADMFYSTILENDDIARVCYEDFWNSNKAIDGYIRRRCIPAWSLHRLIEMMPEEMYGGLLCIFKDSIRYEEMLMNRFEAHFEVVGDNMYNNAISCIEWLIKEGYFNKEYLD